MQPKGLHPNVVKLRKKGISKQKKFSQKGTEPPRRAIYFIFFASL